MSINNPVTFVIPDGGVTESMVDLASGKVLVGASTNLAVARTLSGDVTVDNTGVTAIGATKVTNAMLVNTAVANLSGTNTGDQTNISGNAATVTTNANLTGPVTSTGNATAIANLAVTNAMIAANTIDVTAKLTGLVPALNGGMVRPLYLTSNYTNSTNVLSDVTGLGWTVAANEVWYLEFNLKLGCNNTGGSKLALTFPAGGVLLIHAWGINTGSTTFRAEFMTTSGTATGAFCAVASFGGIRISGTYVNSSTAGTVQLQAQSTTDTQTTTIYANSILFGVRVA